MSIPSVAPSASTLSMSSDRAHLGKIVGHLFIAAKALIEGHVSSMEEVRHEIRTILSGEGDRAFGAADDAVHTDSTSLLAWYKMVIRLIRSTRKVPDGDLSDDFKRELARLIKKGKVLCSGGGSAPDEGKRQIAKAVQLYQKLSGTSYL
jgi:hypothetical protein